MRSILTISLPPRKKEEIAKRAKKSNKTISAYIIGVMEMEKTLISEDELLRMSREAEKDYNQGKTKTLKSLSNLL